MPRGTPSRETLLVALGGNALTRRGKRGTVEEQCANLVICCGGGGIPVIPEGRAFAGVDAAIDMNLASGRLAQEVGVDIFVMATDVERVAIHSGTPRQQFLHALTVPEAARCLADGHFPPGSMGPKVRAALDYLAGGGKRAVITPIGAIEEAVAGRTGTKLPRAAEAQACDRASGPQAG